MADETLSFNIVGNDAGASAAFRNVADSSDLASKGALRLAAMLDTQAKAAKASAAASLTLAKADQILADAENLAAADSTKAADAILAQGDAAIVAAAKNAIAAKSIQDSFKAASDAATVKAFTPGGGWGGLGGTLSLFAVPALTITGWHLLADAIAETTAVVLPATIATVAFGAAATPTVQAIVQQFQNLNTVSGALGKNIYPLTGGFDKLAAAAQPYVYQLLGDALVVVNNKTGELKTLVTGAGQAFDQLAARGTAALVSGGMSQFLKNASTDLMQIGTVIGNIFGTVGNLLKAMPGYANTLLGILQGVTHGLEMFTGSGVVQGILKVGLAFHGAAVYAGLLGTGLAKVIQPTLSGIGKLALNAAVGLENMAGGSSRASEGMAKFAVGAEKAAGLPWGWISVAAVGFGVLAYNLATLKTPAQAWFAQQQAILNQTPAVKGYTLALQDVGVVAGRVAAAQANAAHVQTQVNEAIKAGGPGVRYAIQVGQEQTQAVNDYSAAQKTVQGQISTYQKNLGTLSRQFGGTAAAQQLLTEAGLKWGAVATTNKSQLASDILQMQAAQSAFKAMELGTGRTAAAMNALNISEGTGSTKMSAYLGEMQKIIPAQDQITTIVTGSEQAFTSLVQGLDQTGKDAAKAGASLSGLNKNSLTLRNDFWNTVIPGMQKMIDTLNLQDASTGNLTTAIATQTKQALPWTKGNEAAKATLVALINNALGPGTVSLQTLNKWVAQNSTTMQGFSKIVDTATIKAGTLAGVLQNQLNVQFHQDLLQASGASDALKTYTQDIENNTTTTVKGQSDRARLIKDLENAGFSAKQATAYVNGLSRSMDSLRSRNVAVAMTGRGTYTITQAGVSAPGYHPTPLFMRKAVGGIIHGSGGPTSDQVPVLASHGEYIVKAASVAKYGPRMMDSINAGKFASGGIIGGNLTSGYITGMYSDFQKSMTSSLVSAMRGAIHSATAAAIGTFSGGPGGGAPAANAALARRMMPAWGSGLEWNAWNAVAMAESGWNQFARNPSSGAYGIPQALPPSKMGPAANPPQSNPAAQIAWMISYIRSVYGDPIAAAAHENAYHWYDRGGWLMPGKTVAVNNTGRPERVLPPGSAGQPVTVNVNFSATGADRALLEWLRNAVTVEGGGDVQVALGSRY